MHEAVIALGALKVHVEYFIERGDPHDTPPMADEIEITGLTILHRGLRGLGIPISPKDNRRLFSAICDAIDHGELLERAEL